MLLPPLLLLLLLLLLLMSPALLPVLVLGCPAAQCTQL
jgi:hypothetical protein